MLLQDKKIFAGILSGSAQGLGIHSQIQICAAQNQITSRENLCVENHEVLGIPTAIP
jgi:hypothetical protein